MFFFTLYWSVTTSFLMYLVIKFLATFRISTISGAPVLVSPPSTNCS